MIDWPNTNEQGLEADETRLSKLRHEKESIEAASHCGFRCEFALGYCLLEETF